MTLISEAEALEHCYVPLSAKSVGLPSTLSQKPTQNAKATTDREECSQVGCDLGLDVASQGRKEQSDSRHDGRIYIYRKYFETLLASPKSLRNQLIIEFPTLEGLRSGEVSSLRVELCDLDNGLLHVIDSKTGLPRAIPLCSRVARHIDQYIREEGLASQGILLQSRKKHCKPNPKCRGEGLREASIEQIWGKESLACGLPIELNPRHGREYFATVWVFVKHKSLFHLQVLLGHMSLQSTQDYVNKLVDVHDLIYEFHEGDAWFGRGRCLLFEHCDLADEGCHCRMFQPQTVEAKP